MKQTISISEAKNIFGDMLPKKAYSETYEAVEVNTNDETGNVQSVFGINCDGMIADDFHISGIFTNFKQPEDVSV